MQPHPPIRNILDIPVVFFTHKKEAALSYFLFPISVLIDIQFLHEKCHLDEV